MRELTPHETAAMYHFHDRYAAQRGSAIEFFAALPASDRVFIRDMVDAIVKAIDGEIGSGKEATKAKRAVSARRSAAPKTVDASEDQ